MGAKEREVAAPDGRQEKPERARHLSRNGTRSPDHGVEPTDMKPPIGGNRHQAAKEREGQEPRPARTFGDGGPEGQEPGTVDDEMGEAAVNEHVGHGRGEEGDHAARKLGSMPRIACRNESEREQEGGIPVFGQQIACNMHGDEGPKEPQHALRHIEDRLSSHRRPIPSIRSTGCQGAARSAMRASRHPPSRQQSPPAANAPKAARMTRARSARAWSLRRAASGLVNASP